MQAQAEETAREMSEESSQKIPDKQQKEKIGR
jgi:hypothetical protein